MNQPSKPTSSTFTGTQRVSHQETFDSNTTTFDSETRTFDEMGTKMTSTTKPSSTITNTSKPS